jgi:hypothetical protein
MNWPEPTLTPPTHEPARAHDLIPPPPATPPNGAVDEDTPDERRRLSAVPAAAWVALLGGALVLLAAAIIVASTWDSIGQSFRFAGLAVGTAGLTAVAERLRRLVPTTAGIIAHVAAFLVGPIGIAGMSLLGYTWPTCLLVGGAAAVIATEVQARRWDRETFHVGQVVAIALVATGLAALTGTTAGLIAAIAAAGLLAAGAHRRAAGLSVLAVLSPALTALADAGVGAGTFERAGLVGDELSWSGPVVGLLAAMVLGIVARLRRNNGLMLTAVAAPVVGVVTGLAAVDGSAVAWLGMPALVVIAAELGWWMLPTDRFRSAVTGAIDALAGFLLAAGLVSPWLVAELDLSTTGIAHPWAVPAVITLLAIVLAAFRWRSEDRTIGDVGVAAGLATAVATLVALGAPAIAVAAVAVGAVGAGAFLSRRIHPVAIHVPAFWAVVSIVDTGPASTTTNFVVAAVLLTVLVIVVAGARARLAADAGWIGWAEMTAVVGVTATTVTQFVDTHQPTAALVGAAAAGLVLVAAERRFVALAPATAAAVGLIALDAASSTGTLDETFWIGWAAVTAALSVAWALTKSPIASSGSAAAAIVTVATSAAALPVDAEQFIGLSMLAVAVLTGLAFTTRRRTPLDAAAVAAGVVLLSTTAFEIDPAWVSAAWLVLGLQIWSFGLITRQLVVQLGGAAAAVIAAGSWWFTSGLHDWAMDLIEPADITVGDLWMLIATAVALLVGLTARTAFGVNSWLAYTAGLTIGGLWLTSVQIERDTVWAVPAALTFALVAVCIGAWRRLAAPLVGGTVITATTVFVATGSDLRAIPTWAWFATGGLCLLGVAVLIERTGKPGGGLRELVERWS